MTWISTNDNDNSNSDNINIYIAFFDLLQFFCSKICPKSLDLGYIYALKGKTSPEASADKLTDIQKGFRTKRT